MKLLAFATVCFVVIEQSYRVYAVGPAIAFSPQRFNSMVPLMYTDHIERSPYPEVFFQLKPNLDTWHSGRRFLTNSVGLVDKEYSLQKPDDVFRIVVLGSSWTMGTGVEQQQSYQALLESQLNELYPQQRFEVINFGVELYGLREIVGTLRHRAMQYQPDLIIAALTTYTPYVLWENPGSPNDVLPPTRQSFFRSYVLLNLDARMGTNFFRVERSERALVGDNADLYAEQVSRAFRELHAESSAHDVPLAIMWLNWAKPDQLLEAKMTELADKLGVTYMQTYKYIAGTMEMIQGRRVSKFDNHPNADAHWRISEKVLADLKAYQLIPGAK